MELVLEKRGCNFLCVPSDGHREAFSDIGNYRVCTKDICIKAKNGKTYFLEFSFGNGFRYTNKKNGKPLKHPVRDREYADFLYMDTEYEINGFHYRDIRLEEEINNAHFKYCTDGILSAVNHICGEDRYTSIRFE